MLINIAFCSAAIGRCIGVRACALRFGCFDARTLGRSTVPRDVACKSRKAFASLAGLLVGVGDVARSRCTHVDTCVNVFVNKLIDSIQ